MWSTWNTVGVLARCNSKSIFRLRHSLGLLHLIAFGRVLARLASVRHTTRDKFYVEQQPACNSAHAIVHDMCQATLRASCVMYLLGLRLERLLEAFCVHSLSCQLQKIHPPNGQSHPSIPAGLRHPATSNIAPAITAGE